MTINESKTKTQEIKIPIIYSLYIYIILSYWNISQKSGTKNGLKKAESVYRVIAFYNFIKHKVEQLLHR